MRRLKRYGKDQVLAPDLLAAPSTGVGETSHEPHDRYRLRAVQTHVNSGG